MTVTVRNTHRSPVERAGVVWPPRAETTRAVRPDRLAEVRACRYLTVLSGPETPAPAPTPTDGDEAGSGAETADGVRLAELTVAELRRIADDRGVDAPSSARKADLVAALEAG